jgi:hypothetical protein
LKASRIAALDGAGPEKVIKIDHLSTRIADSIDRMAPQVLRALERPQSTGTAETAPDLM